MNRLKVFLLPGAITGRKEFESLRAKTETDNIVLVVNSWDWRLSMDFRQCLNADALMIVGDWIDDVCCRIMIDIFSRLNKPIFHKDRKLNRKVKAYCKTLGLQMIIGEVFCSYGDSITATIGNEERQITPMKPLELIDLRSKSRKQSLVEARIIFCKVCKDCLNIGVNDIAWLLNCSHVAAIYYLRQYENLRSMSDFREKSDSILSSLNGAQD